MKSNDYQNELAGFVALPNRMQYSFVEFARRIKNHIKHEQGKIAPDNSLIHLLCNAAWLGWESIEGYQASLEKLEAAISASDKNESLAISLLGECLPFLKSTKHIDMCPADCQCLHCRVSCEYEAKRADVF